MELKKILHVLEDSYKNPSLLSEYDDSQVVSFKTSNEDLFRLCKKLKGIINDDFACRLICGCDKRGDNIIKFLTIIATNYPCDEEAHDKNKLCRKCCASEILHSPKNQKNHYEGDE